MALQRHELPLGLVVCGLPTLAANLQKARSYSERLFRGEAIDSLPADEAAAAFTRPLEGTDRKADRGLVNAVTEEVEGYPYFIQLWGSELWDAADLAGTDRLTVKLLDAARPGIYRRLDSDFYEPRVATLTPAEQDILLASAACSYPPLRSAELNEASEKTPANVNVLLGRLVERRRPVTAGPTSLKTSYAILDGFLNFYFRFVEPYGSRLRNHDEARKHLRHTVLPQLDHFVSRPAWERICREHLHKAEPEAREVGAWWGRIRSGPKRSEERELDAVAIDADGKVLATGSCKWTNEPLGYGEERLLSELEAHIPEAEAVQRHYFFSRAGFTEQLQELAEAEPNRVKLVGVDALYG